MNETAAEPSPRFKPTLFHIAMLIPWIALVVTAFERIRDNSYLWHVRAGAMQIDVGSVLTSDPFSFTRQGEPWRTQSWLVEIGYGLLEDAAGLSFTGVMVLAFGGLAMIGIGLLAWRYSHSVVATSVVLLLSAILLPQFLVPRPALFSFPLFVLVVLAWDRPEQRWAVPFLFWIWASVHGSFVIGLGYVVLRLIQARDWRALRIVAVSGAACLATAHGVGVLAVLWEFVQARPYLGLISEWQTPDFLQIDTLPMVIGVLLVVFGATKGRLRTDALWVLAPFLILALSSERAVGPAWIALVPLIAISMTGITARWARGFHRPVALGFGLLIGLLPFLFTERVELDREQFPVEASQQLIDTPTFHDDYSGGYLIWLWGPDRQVYIDDRAELYQELISESLEVRTARAVWRDVFARDQVEQVLLRTDEPLVEVLASEGWATHYEDDRYVVMRPR